MKKRIFFACLTVVILIPKTISAQIDEDQLGAWYMYFFNTSHANSKWGVQGDVQYRNWDVIGDLEQLLLRGGITYKPENPNIKFTLGYAHITTGAFGSDNSTSIESRIYQEALFPFKLGSRLYFNNRIRYEQRFVEGQDFRTRYRYNLFLNIPLNMDTLDEKAIYLALYNEIFINGQKSIGNGNEVAIFDRNRLYAALGYVIKPDLKVQLGFMNQTTDNVSKNQLQLSLHHQF